MQKGESFVEQEYDEEFIGTAGNAQLYAGYIWDQGTWDWLRLWEELQIFCRERCSEGAGNTYVRENAENRKKKICGITHRIPSFSTGKGSGVGRKI